MASCSSSYTDSTGAGAQLTSFEFSGTQSTATTFVGTAGLFPLSVSGRWALFCVNTAETTQSCVVHDASGQVADAPFQNVTNVPPALAGQANLLVYAPVGGITLTARDLSTGTEVTTPILATKSTLQVMGNEAMVVAVTSSSVAWAVAPSGWVELANGVENTWMLPPGGFSGDPAGTASGAESLLLITHDAAAGNVAPGRVELEHWRAGDSQRPHRLLQRDQRRGLPSTGHRLQRRPLRRAWLAIDPIPLLRRALSDRLPRRPPSSSCPPIEARRRVPRSPRSPTAAPRSSRTRGRAWAYGSTTPPAAATPFRWGRSEGRCARRERPCHEPEKLGPRDAVIAYGEATQVTDGNGVGTAMFQSLSKLSVSIWMAAGSERMRPTLARRSPRPPRD